MNKRYYVFVSLIVVIAVGVLVDIFLVSNRAEQDEGIIIALSKDGFTNVKVLGKYKGANCESFNIRRRFQAEKNGKIAYGRVCTSNKDATAVVIVNSLSAKPDPTKLSFN